LSAVALIDVLSRTPAVILIKDEPKNVLAR
jgi:hypothetical protein